MCDGARVRDLWMMYDRMFQNLLPSRRTYLVPAYVGWVGFEYAWLPESWVLVLSGTIPQHSFYDTGPTLARSARQNSCAFCALTFELIRVEEEEVTEGGNPV
jgi:hypothetical protein